MERIRRGTYLYFVLSLLCGCTVSVYSQFAYLPVNQEERWWYENTLLTRPHSLHTAIWPYNRAAVDSFDQRKELLPIVLDSSKGMAGFIKRKLFQAPLIQFREAEGNLNVFPVFALSAGRNTGGSEPAVFQSTRGLHLEGSLGKKWSFYTTIAETQARSNTGALCFSSFAGLRPIKKISPLFS